MLGFLLVFGFWFLVFGFWFFGFWIGISSSTCCAARSAHFELCSAKNLHRVSFICVCRTYSWSFLTFMSLPLSLCALSMLSLCPLCSLRSLYAISLPFLLSLLSLLSLPSLLSVCRLYALSAPLCSLSMLLQVRAHCDRRLRARSLPRHLSASAARTDRQHERAVRTHRSHLGAVRDFVFLPFCLFVFAMRWASFSEGAEVAEVWRLSANAGEGLRALPCACANCISNDPFRALIFHCHWY